MNRLTLPALAVALMLSASSAFAEDPTYDLPGQAAEPGRVLAPELAPPHVEGVPDVADLAPGDPAPDFSLRASTGGSVRLADLAGHLFVILFAPDHAVFERFAAVGDSLDSLGIRLYGVCGRGARALETYASAAKIRFPILSDPDARVSQQFGMYDESGQAIQPGWVLVDEKGTVRIIEQKPTVRPEAVLAVARRAVRGS
jgi:peroxiredoxin Q/BCP